MEKLRKAFGACLVPLLSILLAFLIELIEDNQPYLKHRHLENNESHHQSNHIRQFQDAAKGRLQDNR